MAITLVGSAVGNTQTVTIPAHAAGDLIVIFAFRDGSNTAPTLPTGWTNLTNGGGSTCSMRVGYRIATDSSTTSGTWTSATTCYCAVYRSDGTIGIGTAANTGANSTTITFPALTLTTDPDRQDHSWVVGAYGHRSTNTDGTIAPTGMTNIAVDNTGITDSGGMHHTAGAVSSWTAQTAAVGGTSSGWRAATVEITEIPPAPPPSGSITVTGPLRQTLSATSFTEDIGTASADRIVLVSLTGVPGGGGAPTFTSATIAGVSATLIVEGHSDDSHIWFYAEVPSGSGSQTISFTLAQTLFEGVATVYVLTGADTAGITSQYAFDDSFGFQASTAISVTDSGAIFTAASLFTGQSPSFASSTATPNVSASIETDQRGQYAVDLNGLTAGTFTTSQDTNFCFAMSSVAFAAAAGGPDPVTGSMAVQETGSDTASVIGSITVAGSGAAQETGSDTMAASGGPVVAGSAAAQETGDDTFAGSGTVAAPAVTGTMAAQETGSDVLSAAGGPVVAGSAVAQETGTDTASISGGPVVAGSAAAQETGSDSFVSAGSTTVAGAGAAQEAGDDTLAASGAVAVSGSLSSSEAGGDTFAAVGTVAEAGTVAGALVVRETAEDVLTASGTVVVAGTVAAQEAGEDTASGSGAVGAVTGAMAAQEAGSDSFSASGTNGDVAPPVEWQGRAGLSQRRDEDEQIIAEEDEILLALIAEFLEQKYAVA